MQLLAPVQTKEREIFMDVLRGFAILGIFIANNPFTNKIDVLAENTAKAVIATLIDITGKIWLSKMYSTTAGNVFSLDVKNMASGVYYLKLSDGQNTNAFKVVKQ